jgi:hypothetical protein
METTELNVNNASPAARAQSAPAGKPSSPPANASVNNFEELFKIFSKFGDIKSSGDCITLSNSDKWFKQAKVIDGKKITTTDTGIYFKQIAKLDNKELLSLKLKFNAKLISFVKISERRKR